VVVDVDVDDRLQASDFRLRTSGFAPRIHLAPGRAARSLEPEARRPADPPADVSVHDVGFVLARTSGRSYGLKNSGPISEPAVIVMFSDFVRPSAHLQVIVCGPAGM